MNHYNNWIDIVEGFYLGVPYSSLKFAESCEKQQAVGERSFKIEQCSSNALRFNVFILISDI